MMGKNYLAAPACLLSLLFPLFCFSQLYPATDYPKGYFRNPLNIPISLAANFGELRPNHYHMGLDIRTQKKENLPVFAAADGYIAKVNIEPGGFGQAIYINHPNGYTTLYAHLNQFFPALAAYVSRQQYKRESWMLNIDIPADLFPVKKGDLIAYSGNTGGSQGPHVHFEIRKTADDTNLNPLLFGLPVPDNTPPTFLRLAVYDRTKSVYEQSPRILAVRREGGNFSIAAGLVRSASTLISFAISAFDTQSGSSNPNGIFQAVLYDNDKPVTGFQMDRISYNNTRYLNAHIDYKTRETGGPFLQHLSCLPGYTPPSVYHSFRSQPESPQPGDSLPLPADGVIDLSDGKTHNIRIVAKDAYGNSSALKFQAIYQGGNPVAPDSPVPGDIPVAAGNPVAAEKGNLAAVELPGGEPAATTAGKKCFPGMIDGFETKDCAFYIGEKSLYDTVYIRYSTNFVLSLPGAVSAAHTIGAPFIPLQEPLLVRIHPSGTWQNEIKDKVVMVRFTGNKKEVRKPEWQGGWASARFREFGTFQLVEDPDAPVITPVGIQDGANLSHSSRIAFTVKDNLGSIRSFRAELDGKWLCFTNDKGLAYIYKFDEHCQAGKHELKIAVEDEAGNRAEKKYSFIR
ncbi:M23 family metallopeptidase [Flavitalea flava]